MQGLWGFVQGERILHVTVCWQDPCTGSVQRNMSFSSLPDTSSLPPSPPFSNAQRPLLCEVLSLVVGERWEGEHGSLGPGSWVLGNSGRRKRLSSDAQERGPHQPCALETLRTGALSWWMGALCPPPGQQVEWKARVWAREQHGTWPHTLALLPCSCVAAARVLSLSESWFYYV